MATNICEALRGGHGEPPHPRRGGAVQVEPMKPTLKAPGSKRSKVKYDKLLSILAFNFNLRRYIVALHDSHEANPEHDNNHVTTVAGTGHPGYLNGPANTSEFFGPNHIALSPDGRTIVVVDSANDRQGLTLVHFSAQRKRFRWDWGCV